VTKPADEGASGNVLPDNVLEVRGLSVSYRTPRGRVRALRDVDLTVPRGKVVGIVGESGCGKSTLLNAIMGLLDANAEVEAGAILFDGSDLLRQSPRQLQALRGDRLSMIFQDPMTTLNPVLTVGRQMTDIQYRQKGRPADKRRRSAEMLRRVGISDAERQLDNYPHQFSGGMCQRISIAMALQSEPDLLIADEPTTALDATLEVQILQRLRELQQSFGCSILFISHHLGVVAELCDDVTVMYAGEVVEQGSVRDIFHRARHPYAHRLLDCDPARIAERAALLPTIPGDIPDLVHLPAGCIFHERCAQAMPRCASERPARHAIAAGHSASCHLLAAEMADG
jgi:oligopeptide/dipeptide ABC transporter ATP-binding protein